jgi:hypothetical protein
MTGTSIRTPTTVARAAPDLKPNRLMAAATASSKKLLAPMRADGHAMLCFSPTDGDVDVKALHADFLLRSVFVVGAQAVAQTTPWLQQFSVK